MGGTKELKCEDTPSHAENTRRAIDENKDDRVDFARKENYDGSEMLRTAPYGKCHPLR